MARACVGRVRPGGSLIFITGTHARRPGIGLSIAAIARRGAAGDHRNLALELAPIRANASPPDSSTRRCRHASSATRSTQRRDALRATLPIRRVVGPSDVAALALHLMTNTAVTGATFDVDGGQQLIPD